MIHKKTLAAGIAGILLGTGIIISSGPYYERESQKPKDLARVYEIERKLQDKTIMLEDLLNPSTRITLADLLNPSKRDSLVDYALQLDAERDSLRGLPTFRLTEERYRSEERIRNTKYNNRILAGSAIGMLSAMFPFAVGFGLYDLFKKKSDWY